MHARRIFAVALLLWLACIAMPQAAGERNSWTIPGTLRIAITIAPQSLNPILTTTAYETDLARLCFDGLLAITQDGNAKPSLAARVPSLANGDISRDGTTIRYQLRHNVFWHDGLPFTSEDVAFTWRAIMNPKNNLQTRLGYDRVERVDTPDRCTAVFHMKRPFSPALDSLMGYAVVIPAHLLARFPDLNHVAFNGAPIGTGPFKFVRWIRGDRIEYAANERYHLGTPRLRKVVVKIVPQDVTAALQVRTHEIDWYWRAQATSFRESQGIPGIDAVALEQNAHREMILNTTHPPLDDVRVRQAIALAIDRKLLVERVAFGTAQPACGDVPPFSWAYDPPVRCPYDPAEARRMLATLGFGPEGKPLHLELVFASGQEETQAVVIQIQAMLHAVGIETELHAYDPSMLFALASNGGILSSGKFDLDVSAFINRPDPDDSRLLTCANRAPHGFNASRYCSPEMEAAQRESLESFDRAKRKRAISRIQHLVVRDAPEIYLWWPRELHIVNSDIKGIATPSGLATQLPYQWSI